jgi:hypothetical protein
MSRDPLNIVRNPPSCVVKIHGTSRDDVNGQLGIAMQFNTERGRYVVHLVNTQTTMAIKPDNIVQASTIETYQAQFQQIRKDPAVRRQITHYYNMAQAKLGFKPEYAGGAIALALLALIYFIGFSRTLMILSMIMMVALIIGPDVANGMSPRLVAQHFPRRCRETIEQSAPFARGRLTDPIAAGIVIAMLLLAGTSVFLSPQRSASGSSPLPSSSSPLMDDGTPRDLSGSADYESYAPPPSIASKPSFGFSQAMSAFVIYRTVSELGNDGTGFSLQLAIANAKQMDMVKMGLLAFSIYNLARPFLA